MNDRFNPRPREGATLRDYGAEGQIGLVSIHAPVKGRPPFLLISYANYMFQSTPP